MLVRHPLQSFDPRNFTAGTLGVDGPWSFDPVNLDGAQALWPAPDERRRPFLTGRLPPLSGEVVQLDSLVRFVEHPVKAFLRERLGWYAGNVSDEVDDALPIELDALEKWEVGDRLLTARLAGADLSAAVAAERGPRDPPARAAWSTPSCDDVAADRRSAGGRRRGRAGRRTRARSLEVNVRLPDGRLLIGTVPGVRDGTIVRCIYSRLGPKHRLAAWVRFLALSAAWPDWRSPASILGRGRKLSGRPAADPHFAFASAS